MMIMFDKMESYSSLEGDCWVWQRGRTSDGYGQVYARAKVMSHVHRVSFWLSHNQAETQIVRHICHNPPCWNPAHLISGSQSDNVNDSIRAGRWSYHGKILNPQERSLARELWSTGYFSQREIALILGVSQPTVGSVVREISNVKVPRAIQRTSLRDRTAPLIVQDFKKFDPKNDSILILPVG